MHSIRLGPFLDYQKEGRISARVGWQAQVLAKHKQDRLHCRSWGAFLTAICVNLRTPGRIRTTHISQGHGPSVDGQYSLREARFCLERRLGALLLLLCGCGQVRSQQMSNCVESVGVCLLHSLPSRVTFPHVVRNYLEGGDGKARPTLSPPMISQA